MAELDRNNWIAHARHYSRSALTPLLTAMFVAAILAAPAFAHEFDLVKSDNNVVTFASDEDNNYHWSWWNHFVHYQQKDQYDARTDLVASEQPRWGYNGDTDVIWWAAPLVDNADYKCVKVNWWNGRCNQGHLRFNEKYTGVVPANTGWYLACHEFGHHYGLDHLNTTESGCMTQPMDPWNPPASGGYLNPHMINHINAQY